MEQEQIVEGDKLIAEFMGYETWYHPSTDEWSRIDSDGKGAISFDSVLYHYSWDWLMPVVEKIGSINYEFDISTHYGVEVSAFPMQSIFAFDDDEKHLRKSLIQQVWLAVVEFIKWYNTQSK